MSNAASGAIAPAPQYGITPANTNVSPVRGVESAPFIKWELFYPFGQEINAAIVLDDRGVLFGPRLTPLNAATGEPAGVNIPGGQSAPAVDDSGNIYQWQSGRMHSYAPDGTPRWQGPPTNFTTGLGVKIGNEGTIYARGTNAGEFYAFSRHGQLLWSAPGITGHGPLMAIDSQDNTYITRGGPTGGEYSSYDSNGNHRWTVPWNTPQIPQPPRLGPDGNLYLSEDFGQNTVVRDPATGAVIRQQPGFSGGIQAIGPDGTLYFCSGQTIRTTDLFGAVLWQSHLPAGQFFGRLVVDSEGKVYCTTEHNRLLAYSATGDELWQIQLPASTGFSLAPIIGTDGTVYAMSGQMLTAVGGVVPSPGVLALLLPPAVALGRRRRRCGCPITWPCTSPVPRA
jgi:hypothetical protein